MLYPPELRGRRTIPIAYQGGRIQRHGVCVRCVRAVPEAAILFERGDELDPRRSARPFLSRVERSLYRALGRYDEALEVLSRAYEPFVRDTPETENAKRDFVDFLEAFSDVLLRLGHVDRARHVAQQANDARRRWRIVG